MPRLPRRALVGLALPAVALLLGSAGDAGPQEKKTYSATFDWNDIKPEPTKIGAVRRFFRQETATLGELECHVTTLNPGESPHPPHTHPAEEVIIVREGEIESNVNGKLRRLGPGSVILHGSNEPHTVKNVGTVPATYHVFQWKLAEAAKPTP